MQKPAALSVALILVACYPGGWALEGLAPANPRDRGPAIVWDLAARPLADIPFPSDLGTRADSTSPTGIRLNVPQRATTDHEAKLRRLINRLDGFGTYAPIWLRFEDRVDVADLFARQKDQDPDNDGVYLVNVDPASPGFGEQVALDVGTGPPAFLGSPFVPTLERVPESPVHPNSSSDFLGTEPCDRAYFMYDPRVDAGNLLFETYEEDLDRDGHLDAGEDTDGDGVLDHPNLWGAVLGDSRYLDPCRHLVSFYELQTNSLILRPTMSLRPRTTHAVVVTRRVVGHQTQSPVRSPFTAVHHLLETEALRPLVEDGILERLGLDREEVAFAWSFTTQSTTSDLEAIRSGLYGLGPLARMGEAFPAKLLGAPRPTGSASMNSVYLRRLGRLRDRLQEWLQAPSAQQSNLDTRAVRELIPLEALDPCQTALLALACGKSQDWRWFDDGQAGRHGDVDAHATNSRTRNFA